MIDKNQTIIGQTEVKVFATGAYLSVTITPWTVCR